MNSNQTTINLKPAASWNPFKAAGKVLVLGAGIGAAVVLTGLPVLSWWTEPHGIEAGVIRIDSAINLVPHDPNDVASKSFDYSLTQVGQLKPDMISTTKPVSIQLEAGEPVDFTSGPDSMVYITIHNVSNDQCRALIRSTPFNMDWQVGSVNGNKGVESACYEQPNTLVVDVKAR